MNILYSNHNRIFNIHTDGIPYLSVDLLDRLGVPNLYSTRYISYDAAEATGREGLRVVVMKDEDVREAAPVVFDSRDRLAKQLGSSIERECVTDQMHTNRVYTVRPEDLGPILRQDKPERRRSVDGIITDLPDVVLTAFGGDCPPVYLADPVRRAIGLVHAGWRGTLGRIPAVAIERMGEEFGTDPADLYAAIGRGICHTRRSRRPHSKAAAEISSLCRRRDQDPGREVPSGSDGGEPDDAAFGGCPGRPSRGIQCLYEMQCRCLLFFPCPPDGE